MSRHPFIVAHRGLSATFPENTLPAFERALELPVDAIEFDLHPTRDGRIVVTHDDTLERCSNGRGPVREKTLAELKALDFGAWKSPRFAGTRIPEFNELLDLVERKLPGLFLCVELKENNPECAEAALRELRRRNYLHNCSIISFHPEMLRFAENFEPNLELHGFEPTGMSETERDDYFRMIRRIGLWHLDATAELVAHYHHLGLKVDVWAPDEPASFERAVSIGVDFITTNAADVITAAAGRIGTASASGRDPQNNRGAN